MRSKELIIKGARQNNLKNVSLTLPHDKVIAITGLSGSGKSSLAFDTIFAEGQWRFIESLSSYARLFMEKLDRPAVDEMRNIRPAIALEQKNPVRGSRSTVGTLTELYDYLRLLYAKAATPYCPECGEELRKWSPSDAAAHLSAHHEGQKAMIMFHAQQSAEELKKDGFVRAYIGGEVEDLDDIGPEVEEMEVVVDRLVIRNDTRLADSIETAWRFGHRRVKIKLIDGPTLEFNDLIHCAKCSVELPDPAALLFSFKHPLGACPECKGFGNVLGLSRRLMVPDPRLSIADGAIEPWEKPAAGWWREQLLKHAKKRGLDLHRPYKNLAAKDREWIFDGDPPEKQTKGEPYYGVNEYFEYLESKRYKLHVRVFMARYREASACSACNGARLKPEALAYKLMDRHISELTELSIGGLKEFFDTLELHGEKAGVAREPLRQIELKLGFLIRVGLDYLSLSRYAKTLSGGEYQRVNLSNQLASRLTGTLYVLDEPTVGLHARDTERITDIMRELADLGNTLVVVEHDRFVIESADWVVELGPGGGAKGGELVYNGPMKEFLSANTLTARYTREGALAAQKKEQRKKRGTLTIRGARGHNLKSVDVEMPLGMLCAISGVSGSGKSTLVVETLYAALAAKLKGEPLLALEHDSIETNGPLKGIKLIDQSPIGKSPRSNPVTYLKIFDHIRKLFSEQPEAQSRGYSPGFFSFNVPGGRCDTCQGDGYQKIEMYFFEDLYIKCEECGGRRYSPEALRVRLDGKSVSEVLSMTVDEAMVFFQDQKKLAEKLWLLKEVGLGYITLGQPATTLSGGEAQRLKICSELGSNPGGKFLYILDEPTVGLHPSDITALLRVLNRLVEAGNTVLVIEHNLDVLLASDWLVDLGPEGGDKGGMVLYSGPPGGLMAVDESHTGEYLKRHVGGN